MGSSQSGRVGVSAEAEDRNVRVGVGDLLRIDARDVRDHEIGPVHTVGRDEMVARKKDLQLPPEERVDPTEQDRRHGGRVAPLTTSLKRARVGGMAPTASGFEKGLALIRAGEYFAAHEELEAAWRAGPP